VTKPTLSRINGLTTPPNQYRNSQVGFNDVFCFDLVRV
jgi:hypothetical protein